jgi:hypothetical protein
MDVETNIPTSERSGGELPRFRFLTPLTKDSDEKVIIDTWEKIRTQDYAFDDFSRNNPQLFLGGLVQETSFYFLVDDAALAMVQNCWKFSTSVSVHFCVWDRTYPVQKITQAAKECLAWIFNEFDCHRVNALIPEYNTFAQRLATTLRFRYEGSMKEAILYKGKWCDERMYGLLQSHFIKPEVQ